MIYLIASLIIIAINVVPAFMPPTWTIVSYVYIRYEVSLLFLAFIAAISSSIGRFLLAQLSSKSVPYLFSKVAKDNLKFVGSKIKGKRFKAFLVAFIWAISPIGSNPLFIAVGMSHVNIAPVLAGFFVGRVMSYFSLAYTSRIVVENVQGMFTEGFLSWQKLLINIFGIGIIYIYIMLDWESLIVDKKVKFNLGILKRRAKGGRREAKG